MAAADLLTWAQALCFDGALARCEPAAFRYRVGHVAARLVRTGRSSCPSPCTGYEYDAPNHNQDQQSEDPRSRERSRLGVLAAVVIPRNHPNRTCPIWRGAFRRAREVVDYRVEHRWVQPLRQPDQGTARDRQIRSSQPPLTTLCT